MRLMTLYIMIIFSFSFSSLKAETVNLLNWWNYIAPQVIEKAEKKGFKINLTIYKNEEVAVTRLMHNKDGFDLVIISNTGIEPLLKSEKIIKNAFKNVNREKEYFEFTKDFAKNCLPFLWTATVFTYDPRYTKKIPDNIYDLISLKDEGYRLGIVDDLFEFSSRLILDSEETCGINIDKIDNKNVFGVLDKCKQDDFIKVPKNLSPSDFVNRVRDFQTASKVAVYGWHGAAKHLHKRGNWLKYVVPKKHLVISYDAVCIVNKRHQKIPKERLIYLAKLLTNKENADLNASYTQSFSPYKTASPNVLQDKIKDLFNEIKTNIDKLNFVIINNLPTGETNKKLNTWWRKVRYEKEH
ncbi:MAG: hypothetical protein NTY22_07190 [Proteobacteria bacterium]|nr:hypothetical protein [Pseudomonadota bacterium]